MRPGQPERRTHDYRRHGTTDLFAALDVKAGTVIGACKGRHRASAFRAFLDQVEAAVPTDLDVHLVLDNAATHKTKLVHDWLLKRPRWHLHFTPTSASWLNMVEGWFALLTRRCLQRGVFQSTDALEAAIAAYIAHTNAEPRPFTWTKSADAILASVGRFCQRTANSGHEMLHDDYDDASPQQDRPCRPASPTISAPFRPARSIRPDAGRCSSWRWSPSS